jgi:hypothetical protein
MITNAAMKNGFTGGLIVDFPNSRKAKKYFLFLMAGYSDEIAADAEKAVMLPKARTEGEGYSDVDSDMSDGSDSEEERDSDESSDEEVERKVRPKSEKRVGVAKAQGHMSKTITKARKQTGRFKANGNRKNKEWIMKKKDRMRR